MNDCMNFPDTVEEFMECYKITDTEQIYTNGAELVPVFRMKQWFEHEPERKKGKWINYDKKYTLATCSKCNKITMFELWGTKVKFYDYCPNCGCEMER